MDKFNWLLEGGGLRPLKEVLEELQVSINLDNIPCPSEVMEKAEEWKSLLAYGESFKMTLESQLNFHRKLVLKVILPLRKVYVRYLRLRI